MLLRIFRNADPLVIFLLVVTIALFWLNPLLDPGMTAGSFYNSDPMPLYSLLKSLTGGNYLTEIILTLVMLLLLNYLIVSFNTSVIFIDERTFLPAIIYVLLISLFPEYLVFNPLLPSALFLISACRKILDTYRLQGIAYDLYDAGFLISIGSLFYANFIFFGILLIVAIIILRSANLKEILLALTGLLTPYFLVTAFYYITGRETFQVLSSLKHNIITDMPDYETGLLTILLIIIPAFLLLISIFHLLSVINTRKIKSRKTFFLLLWILAISGASYILLPGVSVDIIWLAAIPAAYFIAHYFVSIRRRVTAEISFTILFLTVVIIHIFKLF